MNSCQFFCAARGQKDWACWSCSGWHCAAAGAVNYAPLASTQDPGTRYRQFGGVQSQNTLLCQSTPTVEGIAGKVSVENAKEQAASYLKAIPRNSRQQRVDACTTNIRAGRSVDADDRDEA